MLNILAAMALLLSTAPRADSPDTVSVLRLPENGLQPQAITDQSGAVHIVYMRGDPAHADVMYARSADGRSLSKPVRVNTQPGSAVAIGTVRGPHVALGPGGRVHVAWIGSDRATPRAPGDRTPLLYSRSDEKADAFEPERNIATRATGLDGGASIGADPEGNVYIAWHAPRDGDTEADRRVWLARSRDGGGAFAPEYVVDPVAAGACGCCALRLVAGSVGRVFILYRSATQTTHRDTYLLVSTDDATRFTSTKVDPWEAGACVMSTAALVPARSTLLAAWETRGQVVAGMFDAGTGALVRTVSMPGHARDRKHPAVAANSKGQFIVVWAEGTGWNQGGALAWQVFGDNGTPIEGRSGRAEGLPVWGAPAAWALHDSSWAVIY